MEQENSLLMNLVRVICKEDMTMIKTKKGRVKLRGTIGEIFADYAVITKSVIKMLVGDGIAREDAVKDVSEAHRIGTLTDEEFIDEQMESVKKAMMDIVAKMSDEKEDGGEADE